MGCVRPSRNGVIHGRRRSLQVAVDLTPFVGGTPPAGNVERDIVDITA